MGNNFLYQLSLSREVSIITPWDGDDVLPIARGLVESGRTVLEVALSNETAVAAVKKIRREFPDAIVGAGAVNRRHQITLAHDVGAQFVVTLGFSEALIAEARMRDMPILSGAAIPTDIIAGLDKGVSTFHFHPAGGLGGIAYLASLSEAFPEAGFYVTGGVGEKEVKSYLAIDNVIAVGRPA
jgi:2-dehydro-3-deoxyphosphogluconate aldolase/(4S)-4-hydroxy-2-oxoglutarate aldolase